MQLKGTGKEDSFSLTDTTPDKTKYKKNSKGQTLYDANGNPIPEEGSSIIKKGLEKIKKLVNPLAGLTSQKPQAPPLPQTPMPNVAAAAMQKNPQTGLTRTETALLSPSEQQLLQGEHDAQKCNSRKYY